MHRGYVRQWRKEQDSDIWDKPPLYLKVWRWILMNVDYETGEVTCTQEYIAERVMWTDNNREVIPRRQDIGRILRWLSDQGGLVLKKEGSGSRKYRRLVVVNWYAYNSQNKELVPETVHETVHESVHSLRSSKHLKEEEREPKDEFEIDLFGYWEIICEDLEHYPTPWNLFDIWRKEFPEEAVTAAARHLVVTDNHPDDPTAYLPTLFEDAKAGTLSTQAGNGRHESADPDRPPTGQEIIDRVKAKQEARNANRIQK